MTLLDLEQSKILRKELKKPPRKYGKNRGKDVKGNKNGSKKQTSGRGEAEYGDRKKDDFIDARQSRRICRHRWLD